MMVLHDGEILMVIMMVIIEKNWEKMMNDWVYFKTEIIGKRWKKHASHNYLSP